MDKITVRRRIDVSRTRCLATTTRLSLLCVYFDGHVRRSVCDTVVPRQTVRNTAYSEPRGVTTYVHENIKTYKNPRSINKILSWLNSKSEGCALHVRVMDQLVATRTNFGWFHVKRAAVVFETAILLEVWKKETLLPTALVSLSPGLGSRRNYRNHEISTDTRKIQKGTSLLRYWNSFSRERLAGYATLGSWKSRILSSILLPNIKLVMKNVCT